MTTSHNHTGTDEATTLDRAQDLFDQEGFVLTPPIVPDDVVARAMEGMDAVLAGEYETGVEPRARLWNPGDDPQTLRKVDMPHVCNRAITELIKHPTIGQWAAAVTGAKAVHVFAVQLLYKPPGGRPDAAVGWHQDRQYWQQWSPESELFTAWIAISDVIEASGPLRFARGSHRWGFLDQGDFFSTDSDQQRKQIPLPAGQCWEEISAVLPPGAVSFHHSLTYHGSRPNLSSEPRRSFAVHLRTEKSEIVPHANENSLYYGSRLDDPLFSPVIYGQHT